MSEQEADICMQLILNLEAQVMTGQREMLKHLYELHKLRDWRFYLDCVGPIRDPGVWKEIGLKMQQMENPDYEG